MKYVIDADADGWWHPDRDGKDAGGPGVAVTCTTGTDGWWHPGYAVALTRARVLFPDEVRALLDLELGIRERARPRLHVRVLTARELLGPGEGDDARD